MKYGIIKDDRNLKSGFLSKYLFGGYNPIYSHKLILVEKCEAKSKIRVRIPYEKISLLFSGVAKLRIRKGK